MKTITLLLGLCLIVISSSMVNAQLPCDSFLRVVRPDLFTHCSSCVYNSWSSWTRTGRPMSSSNCPTKRSFTEVRTRTASQGTCDPETQDRITCEPTLAQQAALLIAALDLGGTIVQPNPGRPGTQKPTVEVFNGTSRISRKSITEICGSPSTEICRSITTPTRPTIRPTLPTFRPTIGPPGWPTIGPPLSPRLSPRDLHGDEVPSDDEVKLADDFSVPNSFDFDGHLSTITTRRNRRQANSNKRYVLFILDSSGSIRSPQFTLMKEVLSDLLPLFCGNAVFGVMSYASRLERNICFDCDQTDRYKLRQALRSIVFHNGGSTRSGDAIKCACDYMLSRSCGYFDEPGSITDVVFLTDGHSNRGADVCTATNCIADDVNVIAIGVGNGVDYDELECIEGDNDASSHIFDVANLTALRQLQQQVVQFLIDSQQVCRSSFDPLP